MDDLDKIIDGLSPETFDTLYRRLGEMGLLQHQQPILAGRMKMAQQLAGTPLPQGREVGRIFVASHPLENVAAGLQRYLGMRDVERLRAQEDKSTQQMGVTMKQLADELARRYGGGR